MRLQRYYHFHCPSDTGFFELLQELGLSEQLSWRRAAMGFFFDGSL